MVGLILVGVDGSAGDEGALRYAADVAGRTGAHVRLAHVATGYSSLVPMPDLDLDGIAEDILRGAAEVARGLVPADRLTAVLLHGQRQSALLEAAKEADLVVLSNKHRPALERLVTGSTITALAAGAACPVVVVPAGWSANEHRAVGVGVKTLAGANPLLAEAAKIAESRGHRLEVVHAWHLPVAAYDALSLPTVVDVDAWQAEMRGALVAEVAGVVADHPGVEVVETVVEGQPAQVLADLCDRVDLLVLARRTRLFPRGHLGGTARALLRELPCPVLVVPPPVPDDPCHLV